MIRFDQKGYIEPYSDVKTDFATFRKTFVEDLKSERRDLLFSEFERYTYDLVRLIRTDFLLWIDGSFTTKEKEPNDVDLVVFVPSKTYNKYEKELRDFKYPESLDHYRIDGYFVSVYPEAHKKYSLYQSDKLYWYHQFTKTRKNRRGNRFSKGFITLAFNDENSQAQDTPSSRSNRRDQSGELTDRKA